MATKTALAPKKRGQILYKANGVTLHVDRTFASGEIPAKQVAAGGGRIELSAGVAAAPAVHMCDCNPEAPTFFYDDGSPLTEPEHTGHFPPKVRLPNGRWADPKALALEFIERNGGRPLPKVKPPKDAAKGMRKPGGVNVSRPEPDTDEADRQDD